MENEPSDRSMDFVEDLCLHYRELEKSKALHLGVCDLMLSAGTRRREWLQVGESKFPVPDTRL